jgi:3-hydroxyisobutyrate dehydrogenase-like beta-hydroxyacid dehydrogenase
MGPVGFVGVGAMGSAIASRLVGAYDLRVTDRNAAAADDLVEAGAKYTTAEDIAATCSVVFLSLPGPADVVDLLIGAGGLAELLRPGAVVIDTTTSTPTADAQITAVLSPKGVEFADAPIAGGVRKARDGASTLMVGATPETFAKIETLLRAITPSVSHVGPVGAGHTLKVVNNLLNACNRFAALEAIRLGQAAGLPQDVIVDVINRSTGRNYTTEYTFPTLLSGDTYKPQGFSLALMLKDMTLANQMARELGHRAPIGALVEELTAEAVERFGAAADQSQLMAEWYETQ